MRTFKLVVAWILLVISALGILVSLGGIVGSWIIRNQVTIATVNLITVGETAVTTSIEAVSRVDNRLTSTQNTINALETEIVNAGANLTENSLVGAVISNRVSEETAVAIGEARATILTVVETVYALDNAIQAANQIPFVNLDGFVPTLVGDLVAAVEKLQTDLTNFRAAVETRREEAIANSVGLLTGFTSEMSGSIGDILTSVNGITDQLNQTSTVLANAKETLPRLFTMIALAVSVFLLIVAIAFASLLLHSWQFTKNPDLTLKELA